MTMLAAVINGGLFCIAFAVGYTACWQSNKAEIKWLRYQAKSAFSLADEQQIRALKAERRVFKLKELHSSLMDAIDRAEAEEAPAC